MITIFHQIILSYTLRQSSNEDHCLCRTAKMCPPSESQYLFSCKVYWCGRGINLVGTMHRYPEIITMLMRKKKLLRFPLSKSNQLYWPSIAALLSTSNHVTYRFRKHGSQRSEENTEDHVKSSSRLKKSSVRANTISIHEMGSLAEKATFLRNKRRLRWRNLMSWPR